MPAPSEIIDRISALPSKEAKNLIPCLYDLVLEERDAWSAYCTSVQANSYTHILRAYNDRAIDEREWHVQTLNHLTHTLPARLAMLAVKSHDVEGGNNNGVQVTHMARSLQGMREVLQAGYPIKSFQLVDDVLRHESACTILEAEHAGAVERVRVALAMEFEEGWIVETADVVVFAGQMLSIGIDLGGLAGMGGVNGAREVLGEQEGVGILPWW